MSVESSLTGAIRVLERDVLRNIVPLKMITAFPDAVRVWVAQDRSVLVLLETAASAYDRKTYPDSRWVLMPAVTDPSDWPELIAHVPREDGLICKLSRDEDVKFLSEARALTRVTAFVSMTGGMGATGETVVTASAPAACEPLFRAMGYTRADLDRMLTQHAGRIFLAQAEGRIGAACFTFHNHGSVHEIGGVYTLPALRRSGLARQVVAGAVQDLHTRGLTVRYQYQEDNAPSRRLAESLGMTQAVCITHWITA